MKTYSAKPGDIDRKWWLVDADGLTLGRMAVVIADRLRGKHKPLYSPNLDCGDHVIVVNAEKVALSGRKVTDKVYHRHTGYPGGVRSQTVEQVFAGNNPERVVEKAVQRMVAKGPMGRQQLSKLRVYAGADHPHDAQSPEPLDIAAMNPKNKRSAASDV